MQTPGPARPAQSLSAVHAPHVFAAEHAGFVEVVQSLLTTHSTQAPLAAHTGLAALLTAHAPAPAGAAPQPTHAPAVEQNGLVAPMQSVSVPHSTQLPPPQWVSVALFAEHCRSFWQEPQVWVVGLQAGAPRGQSLSIRHATQVRVATSQTGFAGSGQSALPPQLGATSESPLASVPPSPGCTQRW
jgi:hypothetical protein